MCVRNLIFPIICWGLVAVCQKYVPWSDNNLIFRIFQSSIFKCLLTTWSRIFFIFMHYHSRELLFVNYWHVIKLKKEKITLSGPYDRERYSEKYGPKSINNFCMTVRFVNNPLDMLYLVGLRLKKLCAIKTPKQYWKDFDCQRSEVSCCNPSIGPATTNNN